jgi:hypothetical protein
MTNTKWTFKIKQMKLKLFLIALFCITATISLTVIQSCDDILSYKASICDIEFRGIKYKYPDVQPDTMTTDVGFTILAYPNQNCYIQPKFNLISSCYATTMSAKWQNEIVQSSFKLTLDRQVIISNDTIFPFTDLFQLSTFINGVKVIKDKFEGRQIEYTITFNPDFLNNITFENGLYNATFTCSTDDSRTFIKQRQVIFKL